MHLVVDNDTPGREEFSDTSDDQRHLDKSRLEKIDQYLSNLCILQRKDLSLNIRRQVEGNLAIFALQLEKNGGIKLSDNERTSLEKGIITEEMRLRLDSLLNAFKRKKLA